MLVYFILYIVIFLICLLPIVGNKNSILSNTLVIFILVVLSALRFNVGTDFNNYLGIYNNIYADNIYNGALEYAFYGISLFLKTHDAQPIIFFSILSFLSVVVCVLGMLKHHRKTYIVPLYLLSGLYFLSFNGIRQSVAIGFILFSVYFFVQKRTLLSVFFLFLATMFHWFSLVFIIIYLVFNRVKNHLLLIAIIILPISLYLGRSGSLLYLITYFLNLLPEKYNYAMENLAVYNGGLSLKVILDNFLLILILFGINKLNPDRYIKVLSLLSVLCIVSSNLGIGVILILRIGYFFQPFILLFYINSINLVFQKSYNRRIAYVILFVFYTLIYARLLSGNVHEIIPYQIWNL